MRDIASASPPRCSNWTTPPWLYDSWVHERDALLPLGLEVPVSDDESLPVLAYSLAIAGTLVGKPTDTVVAGVRLVTGDGPATATPVAGVEPDAAVIIDALSGRGSVDQALAGFEADLVHRLGALARLFLSGD